MRRKPMKPKHGDLKPTTPHVRPDKPKHERFVTTAKETNLEKLKQAKQHSKRSLTDQTVNWDRIAETAKSLKSSPYGHATKKIVKVKRFKMWSNK